MTHGYSYMSLTHNIGVHACSFQYTIDNTNNITWYTFSIGEGVVINVLKFHWGALFRRLHLILFALFCIPFCILVSGIIFLRNSLISI